MLTTESLVAGYPAGFALPPLNLQPTPGSIVRLAGANGAGKSTLLQTIAGRQTPLSGRVMLGAEPADHTGPVWKRQVAALLGDDAWLTGLTAGEHLTLLARAHDVTALEAAITEICAALNLPVRFLDSYPEALSSGQRRKVLLASALIRPAGILLLDEPEQNLDAASVQALRGLLIARAESGTAILLATHDDALIDPERTTTVQICEHPDGTLGYDAA
ncbi:ABC transporter ATP-binding protein [Brevibacterium luteolum]|uniref:ABC transporter ATP-binding protein n=1 Tax=Brevibacterium luteolum TaxID=199591 RepID=UPI003B67843D